MLGKQVKVDFKVISADRRATKNNEPYYVLIILDDRGDKHDARVWNDVLSGIKGQPLPQIDQYWGNVQYHDNVFKGQKQLVIDNYCVYKPEDVHEVIKKQFVEKPVIDVDRVIDRMFHWPFWDPNMQVLMHGVEEHLRHEGVWEKIKAIPAGALYHHSVRGGFLLHIDEMLNFSEDICNVTVSDVGMMIGGMPHYLDLIDYQILRAAIVLHDIGKIYDYDERTLQFQSNPVSECLEHTIVGILMVERYWIKDSAESIDRGLRLQHAIAAHHGPEMGAVKPKTPEAIILHHLDVMSAHLDVCRRAYNDVKKTGNPPEYSRMMGARPFVPQFFPLDYSVCQSIKKLDPEVTKEEVELEVIDVDKNKLPWEN